MPGPVDELANLIASSGRSKRRSVREVTTQVEICEIVSSGVHPVVSLGGTNVTCTGWYNPTGSAGPFAPAGSPCLVLVKGASVIYLGVLNGYP